MKLYTKTGDKGQTGLIGGSRVMKNDVRIEAYGTVDELNSFIGLLTCQPITNQDLIFLRSIQHQLFSIGSYLATDRSKVELSTASILKDEVIVRLESEIDRIDEILPKLSSFILPGGSQTGSMCHICRAITRRAERRLFDVKQVYDVDNQIIIFVNRLSDYFFALSRLYTLKNGGEEICWKSKD
ncbi:MAG: cob(I)yrinic acid a,c-diamide adenosyltransferase [Paludibacter sp.]|nr:cob(I)yrinic acid a,c-diamide adenosyltransferase [Paludibacter sp.]